MALAVLVWLWRPYRLETMQGFVSKNETGCRIEAANYSPWKSHPIGHGIDAEDITYPLEVYVFVTGCPAVPNGRPYAAELISLTSGKVVAHGLACANAPQED